MFIIPSAITAIGFLLTFFQLLFSKPSTKKVLVPIIVFTSVAFAILIALDFYLEFQLTHLPPPPKEVYTKTEPSHDEKKGKTRFKMGYLVIYGEIDDSNRIACQLIFVFQSPCASLLASFILDSKILKNTLRNRLPRTNVSRKSSSVISLKNFKLKIKSIYLSTFRN